MLREFQNSGQIINNICIFHSNHSNFIVFFWVIFNRKKINYCSTPMQCYVIAWGRVELKIHFHMYFQSFCKLPSRAANNFLLFLVRNESSLWGISFVAVALNFQQSGLKSQTPKNLKEVIVAAAQNEETN